MTGRVVRAFRVLVVAALLLLNYSLPVSTKPTCWECESCTSWGACCVGYNIGHSECSASGSSCTVSPEECPFGE